MLAYVTGNIFTNNDTAVDFLIRPTDSIFNNYIFHNHVGIIYHGGGTSSFFNNYICNNSIYNIIYATSLNGSIPPICYCDTDSATIRSKIYDGYVNIALGLLSFTPFVYCDSSVITSIPPINCQTLVTTQVEENTRYLISGTFECYPNPASDHIALNLSNDIGKGQLRIFNILGELKYNSTIFLKNTNVDVSGLSDGIYLLEVTTEKNVLRHRLVREGKR
jgi:hypothetical protein